MVTINNATSGLTRLLSWLEPTETEGQDPSPPQPFGFSPFDSYEDGGTALGDLMFLAMLMSMLRSANVPERGARLAGELPNQPWTSMQESPGPVPKDASTFRAPMHIDSDGAAWSHGDPCYQARTSLQWRTSGGTVSADAAHVPYVVLPESYAKRIGAKLGDLVKVTYNGRSVYGIYADNGPAKGEVSMALASALGVNANPRYGGVDGANVEYAVLPGSGAETRRRPHTFEEIQAMGRIAFEGQEG